MEQEKYDEWAELIDGVNGGSVNSDGDNKNYVHVNYIRRIDFILKNGVERQVDIMEMVASMGLDDDDVNVDDDANRLIFRKIKEITSGNADNIAGVNMIYNVEKIAAEVQKMTDITLEKLS